MFKLNNVCETKEEAESLVADMEIELELYFLLILVKRAKQQNLRTKGIGV